MLQSRALVVGRTLGEELEKTFFVVLTKLKTEMAESTSPLKATLEAMEAFKEKMHQDSAEVEKARGPKSRAGGGKGRAHKRKC